MKIFVTAVIALSGLQVFAAYDSKIGETAARHFDFQLKTSKTQKDLLSKLYEDASAQSKATAFLRKAKSEGLPVPKSAVHGTVLELQGQHPIQIDFAKLDSGHILLQKVDIDLNKNPSLEDIYRQAKGMHKSALMIWLSSAYAEDSNENVTLGSLFVDVARVFIPTKDSKSDSASAPSSKMKHLLRGYGEGRLSDFTCDSKTRAIRKIETVKADQSTVVQMQSDGLHLKAERQRGNQTCTVKTLGLHGDPGYGNPSASWVCGKAPVDEKDLFPANYAEELNSCCQSETCEKELHKHLSSEKTTPVKGSGQESGKGVR